MLDPTVGLLGNIFKVIYNPSSQFLDFIWFCFVYDILQMTPKNKSNGVALGNLGGQSIESRLLIHFTRYILPFCRVKLKKARMLYYVNICHHKKHFRKERNFSWSIRSQLYSDKNLFHIKSLTNEPMFHYEIVLTEYKIKQ